MDNLRCERCESNITFAQYKVTMNRYHKALCFDCQEPEIEEMYANQPKLKEFALNNLRKYREGRV